MIIVKIHGGLGNQLFQYAFGKALSVRNNVLFKLYAPKRNDRKDRPYWLDNLRIEEKMASEKEITLVSKVKEKTFSFDNRFLNPKSGFFEGYWQSPNYFSDLDKNILISEFSPKQEINNQILNKNKDNSVSLHIRRGDYIDPLYINYHGICDIEYYKKSVSLIKMKVPNPYFFIFSDDIQWCKDNLRFIDSPKLFFENNLPYQDIYLMSKCSYHIISNSTFSWWGAWLSSSNFIISPKRWFVDNNMEKQTNTLIPYGWIRI